MRRGTPHALRGWLFTVLSVGFLATASAARAQEQSPIDLRAEDAVLVHANELARLHFDYSSRATLEVVNTGSPDEFATVRANVPAGAGGLTVEGVKYELLQFHWHTPSEHRVAGEEFPMEMHLVHQGPGGSLLVVGIFLREGHRHGELEKVFADLPDEGETTSVAGFKLSRLLPGDRRSLRYRGSLTTPPFTEGVSWVVLADPLDVPGELIDAFQTLFPDGNSREPQPLNGRTPRTDAKWKSVGKAAALEGRPGARLERGRGSNCRETGILADSIDASSSP